MTNLLTVKEVASRLRLHEITVRRHIKDGRLRAIRVGRRIRLRQEDVEEMMSTVVRGPALTQAQWRDWILTPPTEVELARRRGLVNEILARRDSMKPLDISTTDLVRMGRRERDRGQG